MRGWLIGDKEGEGFLQGSEVFTWDLPDGTELEQQLLERDLVSLYPNGVQQDPFSKQMTSRILDFYHSVVGSRSKVRIAPVATYDPLSNKQQSRKEKKVIDHYSGVMNYNDDTLLRINTIIVSVISSALPVLAIVVLYLINTTPGRIGAMVAFTVVFAFCLAAFTDARRLEIFASTSA